MQAAGLEISALLHPALEELGPLWPYAEKLECPDCGTMMIRAWDKGDYFCVPCGLVW